MANRIGPVPIMLTQIPCDLAPASEPLAPNATTTEAMREARQGGLPSFASVKDLMADLNADD
jgi:DNA-damage-inducible protein J